MKRSHPSSPTSNDDDQESPSSSSTQSLRLMVHAVDGAVPYLTPHLLQACFPPKDYHDVLSIGIAVRDTCIVPIFHETSKKARGYTFSSETKVDAWLRPTERQPAIEAATATSYHCITVPSFDLWQDVLDTNNNDDTSLETPKHQQKQPKNEQQKQPKQKQQQKQPKQQQQLSVTDKHVAVWTVNGRHVLTPEAYGQASRSLHSNITLQLYDMIPPTTMTQQQQPKQQSRRRLVALSRNEKWLATTAALDHDADDSNNNHSSLKQIWAAALPLADTNSDNDKTLEYTSILTRSNNNNNNKEITGVALVGWQHVPDANLQTESIQALVKAVHDIRNNNATTASPLTDIAVLSTTSLDQIFKCAAAGCTVIGSHLPETWARKKKAFLIPTTSTSNNRKRMRTNDDDDDNNKSSSDDPALEQLDSDGCFDLTPTSEDSDIKRQHVWARDTRPLFPGSNGDDACTCFTCQTHTRAYLYHLVCAKELLADMLLFIHNLHHMLRLFRELNKARAEHRIKALIENIKTSLNQ